MVEIKKNAKRLQVLKKEFGVYFYKCKRIIARRNILKANKAPLSDVSYFFSNMKWVDHYVTGIVYLYRGQARWPQNVGDPLHFKESSKMF